MEDNLNDMVLVETIGQVAVCKDKFRGNKFYVVRLNARGEAVCRMATRRTVQEAKRAAQELL